MSGLSIFLMNPNYCLFSSMEWIWMCRRSSIL